MEPNRAELRAGQLRACGLWASLLNPDDPNSDLIVAWENPEGKHVSPEIMMLSVAEQYLLRQAEKAEAKEMEARFQVLCAQYNYVLEGILDIVATRSTTSDLVYPIRHAIDFLGTPEQTQWRTDNAALTESSRRIMDSFINKKQAH